MDIVQLLGSLGGITQPKPPVPFGMDGPMAEMRGAQPGLLAMPEARVPQAPQMPQPQKRGGVKDFLGKLGDALLIGNGADPIYSKQIEQEQLGQALAQYLGTADPKLVELIQQFPAAGMQFYNASREDKRFERTAGQDDRRIGISEGQLGLSAAELAERARANRAGEQLTERGQTMTANTQVKLQRMRAMEAEVGRRYDAAMKANDYAHAKEMLGLQQEFQREIKSLEGGGAAGYEETVTEIPGEEAKPDTAWFGDNSKPATPGTKTTIRRPITAPSGQVTSEAQYKALPKGATFVGPDGKTYRKP